MKKKFLIIAFALLFQSCCVYHSTENVDNKKVTEFGFAPYGSRPTSQMKDNYEVKK